VNSMILKVWGWDIVPFLIVFRSRGDLKILFRNKSPKTGVGEDLGGLGIPNYKVRRRDQDKI